MILPLIWGITIRPELNLSEFDTVDYVNLLQRNLRKREPDITLDELSSLYVKYKAVAREVESLSELRNNNTDHTLGKQLKEKLRAQKQERDELFNRVQELFSLLPNTVEDDVPVSLNGEDKKVVSSFGPALKPFAGKNHIDIGKSLDILRFDVAQDLSGTGFSTFKGKGAELEWALIFFMTKEAVKHGFTLYHLPHLVQKHCLEATGSLPKFEGDLFKIEGKDLYLIPTAETPLTNLYRNKTLDFSELPIRASAFSLCFRNEPIAYTKQNRGLGRMHQFDKVELYSFCTEEQAQTEYQRTLNCAISIVDQLGLPGRVTLLPSGDIAQGACKTCDIEVFIPELEIYKEVASGSLCGTYQMRKTNTRYKAETGEKKFPFSINCSGVATPRLLISLIDHYQTSDGHIIIPEVLRPFTGFDRI